MREWVYTGMLWENPILRLIAALVLQARILLLPFGTPSATSARINLMLKGDFGGAFFNDSSRAF